MKEGLIAGAGVGLGALFAGLIFWSIVWKGFALWIAAKEESKWWFIPMLVLNTAGILEIIYIFGFSKWGRNYFAKKKESMVPPKKGDEGSVETKDAGVADPAIQKTPEE